LPQSERTPCCRHPGQLNIQSGFYRESLMSNSV
jgi:hypothetical protein